MLSLHKCKSNSFLLKESKFKDINKHRKIQQLKFHLKITKYIFSWREGNKSVQSFILLLQNSKCKLGTKHIKLQLRVSETLDWIFSNVIYIKFNYNFINIFIACKIDNSNSFNYNSLFAEGIENRWLNYWYDHSTFSTQKQSTILFSIVLLYRGEAAKFAHLIESASLKRKYMTKNYEKIFI